MKKVIVLFVAILAFAANSFAQDASQTQPLKSDKSEKVGKHRGGKGKRADGMKMNKELNLTADQSKHMKDIGNTYKGKMQALRTDNSLSKEQKKAQMTEIKKSHDTEVKGVLNTEQYTKMTNMKKQRHDKMKAHKSEHKGKAKKEGETKTAPKSN